MTGTPEIEFFGQVLSAGATSVFSGFAKHNGVVFATARIDGLPELEPAKKKKKAGRKPLIVRDITFLAHVAMVKRLRPLAKTEELRMEARRAMSGVLPGEERKLPEVDERNLRGWLENARDATSGLTVGTCISVMEGRGWWFAVERLPTVKSCQVTIDSDGWFCASGTVARWMHLRYPPDKK